MMSFVFALINSIRRLREMLNIILVWNFGIIDISIENKISIGLEYYQNQRFIACCRVLETDSSK